LEKTEKKPMTYMGFFFFLAETEGGHYEKIISILRSMLTRNAARKVQYDIEKGAR
jgi:hypothetical protein